MNYHIGLTESLMLFALWALSALTVLLFFHGADKHEKKIERMINEKQNKK